MEQSPSKRCPKETSKYHRDQLKVWIDALKDELDVTVGTNYCPKTKMGHLQVLHLATSFLKKDEYFQTCVQNELGADFDSAMQREIIHKALFGFLVMVDSDSKDIIYLSENVYDYLGFGMADLYFRSKLGDMVIDADRPLSNSLLRESIGTEQNAVLRMLVGGPAKRPRGMEDPSDYEVFHVWGQHFRYFSGPQIKTVFVGLCMPLPSPRHVTTAHKIGASDFSLTLDLEMKLLEASPNCQHLVGSDLAFGSSWYQLLHPNSLKDASAAHSEMLGQHRAWGHAVVLGYGWAPTWCYSVLQSSRLKDKDVIVITNRVIQPSEVAEFKRFCAGAHPKENTLNLNLSRKRRHESNPSVPTWDPAMKIPRPASTCSAPELMTLNKAEDDDVLTGIPSDVLDFVLGDMSKNLIISYGSPSTLSTSDGWSPAPENNISWSEDDVAGFMTLYEATL